MTRGMLNLATAALFTIAAAAPSFGLDRHEQRNVYVSGGRETRIASYGAPDENCKAGARPQIEIAERPSYGTLADRPVRIIAERAGVARQDHPCIGKFIDSIAVYYRPVAGFRGSDRVRLRVKFVTTIPAAAATIMEEEIFIGVR
jgi:hypothetical protein